MGAKIYISGKISGLAKHEYEFLFEQAENELREAGHIPINPCKIHSCEYDTWEEYMLADIRTLFACDGIYMLHNWRESKGAKIEHCIAAETGKKLLYQKTILV